MVSEKTIRGFEFSILPYTQNRKLGNLEIRPFLQILTVVINQDLKTTKIWTEQKAEMFRYNLKEKIKISEVSEFSILLYTQNRKLGNLGKFYFTLTFSSSIWNPRSKHQKKTWHKKYNFWCGLIREKLKFPSFTNLPFDPMNKIEISEISESFRLL